MNTSIQPWGNSNAVRIPKVLLDQLSWVENQEVSLEIQEDSIIIKKVNPKMTLQERYEEFYGCAYEDIDFSKETEEELDFGDPVGEEIW